MIYGGDKVHSTFEAPWSTYISQELLDYDAITEEPFINADTLVTGSLISPHHVLTAGHVLSEDMLDNCINHTFAFKPSANMAVSFGGISYDVTSPDKYHVYTPKNLFASDLPGLLEEAGCLSSNTSDPDDFRNFNDIAILEFDKPVEYDWFIMPVCLTSKRHTDDKKYEYFGYGVSGTFPEELKLGVLKYGSVREIPCENASFEFVNETDILCTQHVNNLRASACEGDSGSAIVSSFDNGRRWQAHGVFSRINADYCRASDMGNEDVVSNMAGAWTSVYDHRHFICSATGICVGDAEDLGESAYRVDTLVTLEKLKEIYQNELNKWYQKRNETADSNS
ncbi:hypothetical protein WR25_06841 [Diploscapter pachys]|uniref:Peptidase S1 domain-containing protein n=1 Tax=Diploscapter pachys TaxID=2018661 RepID=A0A2A2JHR5_9BILA|nr:hypothetical protein WR25_06841 [Diploscapter pachys]